MGHQDENGPVDVVLVEHVFHHFEIEGHIEQIAKVHGIAKADHPGPQAFTHGSEQLHLINADARRLMQTQQTTFNRLRREMEAEGISIVPRSKLTARDLMPAQREKGEVDEMP